MDAFFALADRIEAKLAAARQRVERLTQAVLAKAFRGELVPTEAELARREGRDYEPAGVLLERIRTERAAAGTPRKPPAKATASNAELLNVMLPSDRRIGEGARDFCPTRPSRTS